MDYLQKLHHDRSVALGRAIRRAGLPAGLAMDLRLLVSRT
jgi:hypothetical protein